MLHAPFRCRSLGEGICPLHIFTRHLTVFLVILCSVTIANSQRPLGSWNIINAKLNFNDHWAVWTEGQLRSLQFYNEFNYYEVKGGVTYSLKDHMSFTIGLGRYDTYSPGGNFEQPLTFDETRTWLQIAMEQKLDRINFEHRYRVEQRHLNTGYRNRFRYRLNATIPINHKDLAPKTLFAYIGDEVFFTNKQPYYERNRFFTGLGYKITPIFSVLSGYMRQFNYALTSHSSHDYLQVALFINLHLEDFHKQDIPSASD